MRIGQMFAGGNQVSGRQQPNSCGQSIGQILFELPRAEPQILWCGHLISALIGRDPALVNWKIWNTDRIKFLRVAKRRSNKDKNGNNDPI